MITEQLASEVFTAGMIFAPCFMLLCYILHKQRNRRIARLQPESDKHLEFMQKRDSNFLPKVRTK